MPEHAATTGTILTGSSAARLDELRRRHPRFSYDDFRLERGSSGLRLRYQFRIHPDIQFAPETLIEVDGLQSEALSSADSLRLLGRLAFQLGLVEMLSYWKAACSPLIEIRAGALDARQCSWWENLLHNGMGEYFYVNGIDFRPPEFLRIVSAGAATLREQERTPRRDALGSALFSQDSGSLRSGSVSALPQETGSAALPYGRGSDGTRDLVLVSGGKDSVVTLESLKAAGREFDCLLLNPTQAALDIARQAGCTRPIIVRRTIDPRLLKLNAAGYLNGHTPFSAMLAFLGLLVAALCGHRRVIVSNERSAEEATVEYLGRPVNHQYSKTLQFETIFREYAAQYLAPKIEYFSLLRPVYELQIARRFARYPEYFPLFRSCNRGQAANVWCGRCAKCLFVWTVLYPFVEREQMLGIFGSDLFASEGAATILRALLGLDTAKPFECVGTREETLAALHLCAVRYGAQGVELPSGLRPIQRSVLSSRPDLPQLAARILSSWSEQHWLPTGVAEELRNSFFYNL